jgi:predicted DNA-binding transcriptional regulator YafY
MTATNGRYYLIGNYDKYNNLANCRVDRITNIRLLDTPVKPKEQVDGGKTFSLPKHMAEHLYMFSGESVPVTFRMKKNILNDVIDWFGTEIAFSDETEDEVTARVTVNWSAMRHWALQYCRNVTVLTPADLAQTICSDLSDAFSNYKEAQE